MIKGLENVKSALLYLFYKKTSPGCRLGLRTFSYIISEPRGGVQLRNHALNFPLSIFAKSHKQNTFSIFTQSCTHSSSIFTQSWTQERAFHAIAHGGRFTESRNLFSIFTQLHDKKEPFTQSRTPIEGLHIRSC